MKEEQISALAKYFSGPSVVVQSILLGTNGKGRENAVLYFAARSALGIEGYPNEERAAEMIRASLS